MANALRTLIVAIAAFFIGGRAGPLVYPYKLFSSDNLNQIVIARLNSLVSSYTYVGPYALRAYAFFFICFTVSYFLLRLRSVLLNLIYWLALGVYIDIMFNGAVASRIYDFYSRIVGPYPEDSNLALIGYYLTYVAITLGFPVAVAYALSLFQRVQFWRRKDSEPQFEDIA